MNFKKLFSAVSVIIFSSVTALNAQSFEGGDRVLGLSFGIGGHYGVYKNYSSQTPAFGAFYEKGMDWEAGPGTIGMGIYLGYKSLRYKEEIINSIGLYRYDYKWSYTIIGLRGAYHYEFLEKLDTYGGLLLSYNIASFTNRTTVNGSSYNYDGGSGSGFDLTFFLGGRYFLSDQWAALMELGYGIAYLQIGAAYKF